jgi:predicted CXXCH cytochrome family protein
MDWTRPAPPVAPRPPRLTWRRWPVAALLALALPVLFLGAAPARAQSPAPASGDQACLVCHGQTGLTKVMPNGDVLSLYISPDALSQSVHTLIGIGCVSCHADITSYPHPAIAYTSARELSFAYYQTCQKCHPDNYARTHDALHNIHAQISAGGNLTTPVCTDCHGAHDTREITNDRIRITQTCGRCHADIYAQYQDSVHGTALLQETNLDVPVCTDCHGVHSIADPRLAQFRIGSPEMCAGCHANAQLMGKYGLSADVYELYTLSWHGVDVTVYKARWPTIRHDSAVCTDCHGVHNIRKASDPASTVNPANLLATCQRCHPQAGPNWTGAWTGHNRINATRTPSLFYTEAFYNVFVWVVLWGCVVYVGLQILRAVVGRFQRSLR